MGATFSAYHKHNCAWPLRRAAAGFLRVTLAARIEAALRHLLLTPKGQILAYPDYGTLIYRYRGQPMNSSLIEVIMADLRACAAKYIPDASLVELEAVRDGAEQRLEITLTWILRGASGRMHGELSEPKKLTVLI